MLIDNRRVAAFLLGALLCLGGGFYPGHSDVRIATAAPRLGDLKGIDELRSLFNSDIGQVRLVLLLSPT